MRTVTPVLPTEIATWDGLSYSLWLPEQPAAAPGGVVILHGAGSCKENHHDFARASLAAGLAALVFDQRGHGASEGAMDGQVLEDVAAMAALLRSSIGGPQQPVVLRGSSLGGYLAIVAAQAVRARGVVAICPASAEGLRRGLATGAFGFRAEVEELAAFLSEHELDEAVGSTEIPILLLHAEGDERVPVEHSRELAGRLRSAEGRLITVPGGHHRSVQHDPELVGLSLRWISRVLDAPPAPGAC
jgi:alpha-beta hydrolase superfamily lysophospholipase